MSPVLLGVIALVVIAAIALFVRKSKSKPDQLEGQTPETLPPPKDKPIEKPAQAEQPVKVEPAKPAPVQKQPAQAEQPVKVEPAKPAPVPQQPAQAEQPVQAEPAKPAPVPQQPAQAEQPVQAEPAKLAPVPQQPAQAAEATKGEAIAESDTSAPLASKPGAVPVQSAEPAKAPSVEIPAERPARGEPKALAKRDVTALRTGLKSARASWVQKLVGIFSGKKELDPELLTNIEEVLLTGDVGVRTTEKLIAALKERLDKKDLANEAIVWQTLRDVTREIIDVPAAPFGAKKGDGPLVILVVGVNGVGKTTTIGKLAARYKEQGKKVYLAAGDTFRAAAVAQLELWGKRVGVHTVKGKDLTKPSAVVYDAVQQAVKDGVDVVIADTAGRLHTKTPLMDELRKLGDAAAKALPGAPHEILLVLDATTGQNAVVQVNEFKSALAVSGIVLTKLDGTAKGGVILSVCEEHKIPVRFVGVGEKVDDLREFNAEDFSEALFSSASGDESEASR